MLVFHVVRYKNILSSGNMITEIRLDQNPLTIIQGKNGSGKSTLLDALCVGLFGKPYRKINKPALVNNRNRKDMLVEVEFTVNDTPYKVIRGLNPAVFKVFRDGVLIDQNSANADYQAYFEKYILKYDYSSFTQLVIIGKAMYVGFLKLDAAKRRSFIENMLSLSVFGNMAELHKKQVSELKDRLLDLNNNLKLTKERISIRTKYIEDLEVDFRQKKEASLKNIETEISSLNENVLDLEKQEQEQRLMFEEVSDIKPLHTKLSSLFDFRSKFSMKAETFDREIEFFGSHDKCPSCDQAIDAVLKQQKIEKHTKKRADIMSALSKIREDIARLEAEIQVNVEATNRNTVINERCRALNASIRVNRDKLKELEKSKLTSIPDRGRIDTEIETLEQLRVALDELQLKKDAELELQDYYELVTSSLKDTGIKSMVVKKFVPIINNTINKYLRQLGFFVKFVIDENFDETIYSRGVDAMNYYNFSEGEKLRIDLAILLSWRELIRLQGHNTTNLIIFDEILDASMDQEGSENFLHMLSEMGTSNIFIISHNYGMWANKSTPKIVFEKVQGYSKMRVPN